MYNVVRMILTTSLFFFFFSQNSGEGIPKVEVCMTAGLEGKIMGLIFITREGKGVGVGFLSQIPWGLEIQEGG